MRSRGKKNAGPWPTGEQSDPSLFWLPLRVGAGSPIPSDIKICRNLRAHFMSAQRAFQTSSHCRSTVLLHQRADITGRTHMRTLCAQIFYPRLNCSSVNELHHCQAALAFALPLGSVPSFSFACHRRVCHGTGNWHWCTRVHVRARPTQSDQINE
jgi:hypothetical protein